MSVRFRGALVLVLIVIAIPLLIAPRRAPAFTQSGLSLGFADGIPMGHEWITRMAAIELLVPPDVPDQDDPRTLWTNGKGKAKNLDISSPDAQPVANWIRNATWNDVSSYAPRYKAVYDVIIGERWVDIA